MYFFLFLSFLCLVTSAFSAEQASPDPPKREVRVLVPPTLDVKLTGQKFVGYRPYRKGGPRIEIEDRAERTIIHNYGHGGSGWTMAPGCAKKMVASLLNHAKAKAEGIFDEAAYKQQPVSVLGAGVVGIYMAYELYAQGFTNISVIAEQFKGIASDVSGGLIAPISLGVAPYECDDVLLDTYRIYESILKGTHPHFKTGVRAVTSLFPYSRVSRFCPLYSSRVNGPPEGCDASISK